MRFHPDVLAAHAEFGGDLEDMQRRYDAPSQTSDQERAAPAQQPVADDIVEKLFVDLRGRRYLKWIFSEHGDKCLIERAESGEWVTGISLDVQDEIRAEWRRIAASSIASSEPELMAEIVRLTRERDDARGIVRDIHWMAVRYADNRKSYAVGMCNDALRKAYDGGWLVHKGDKRHALDPQYARHGLFDAEWRSAVDAATGRAEAAESRVEALSAEVGTARVAAFEEAAQIAEKFGEPGFDPFQSNRIAAAIRSRAALDKGAARP